MNESINSLSNQSRQLAREAGEILSNTVEAGGDTYRDAKSRLGEVMDSGKKMLGDMKENLAESARSADSVVQANYHQAIVVAVVVGTLAGLLAGWRLSRRDCLAHSR